MDCLQPLLRGPVGGGGVGGLLPRLPSPVLFPLSKHSRLEETNLLLLLLLGDAVRGAVFGEGGGAPRTAFSKVLLPTVWGRHGGGGMLQSTSKWQCSPSPALPPAAARGCFLMGPEPFPTLAGPVVLRSPPGPPPCPPGLVAGAQDPGPAAGPSPPPAGLGRGGVKPLPSCSH